MSYYDNRIYSRLPEKVAFFNLYIFLDQRKYTLYSHNAYDRYVRLARQSRYQTKSIRFSPLPLK